MNTTMITGRLTKDAVIGQTTNGTPFARFTIASDRKGSSKNSQQEPNFIPVELYGKMADAISEYLKKGKPFAVIGPLRTGSYKNSEGSTVYTWNINADRIEFLPEGAMTGTNEVMLIGRLVEDAKQSYTKAGVCVTELRIACDRLDKEKRADFLPVVLYGKLGESLGRYLVKGKSVAVCGEIETGSYKNSEGATVFTWKIVADSNKFKLNGDGGKKNRREKQEAHDMQESLQIDEETGFVELPPEFDEEYFDDEEF